MARIDPEALASALALHVAGETWEEVPDNSAEVPRPVYLTRQDWLDGASYVLEKLLGPVLDIIDDVDQQIDQIRETLPQQVPRIETEDSDKLKRWRLGLTLLDHRCASGHWTTDNGRTKFETPLEAVENATGVLDDYEKLVRG